MKILIVTPRFWPENFRINDIAETLVNRGHEVVVVTGLPNYPDGCIYMGYKSKNQRREKVKGYSIVRSFEIPRKKGVFFRLLNYYSFPVFAKKIIMSLPNDFDVVFVNGLSPVMSAWPALSYAKKHRKRIVMYEMDLWPESLLAGGINPDSLTYRYFRNIAANIYRKFDQILVSSPAHSERIKQLPGCEENDIVFLPQYAESLFETGNFETTENGVVDAVFAGNVGKAQSIETILRSAELLKTDKRFRFHIVGGGSELEKAKKFAEDLGLENVVFYGNLPLESMPHFYSLADVMLVTLEDKPYANFTIPGKVQSYLACGKAILASANGATSDLINNNKCGIAVPAEDFKALSEALKNLTFEQNIIFAKNAKKLYESRFKKAIFFESLEKALLG